MTVAALGERIAGLVPAVRLALFAAVALIAFGLGAGLGAALPALHGDRGPTPAERTVTTSTPHGEAGTDHSMEGS